MEPLTVEKSVWINAPQVRVWKAVTTADQIPAWWGGEDWEIAALEKGGMIKFGDPDNLMLATIDELDPPRQFTLCWPPEPHFHAITMDTMYLLAEEKGGTQVTVRETGFELLPDDVRQQRFDSTSTGYQTVLRGLKTYVEGGG